MDAYQVVQRTLRRCDIPHASANIMADMVLNDLLSDFKVIPRDRVREMTVSRIIDKEYEAMLKAADSYHNYTIRQMGDMIGRDIIASDCVAWAERPMDDAHPARTITTARIALIVPRKET